MVQNFELDGVAELTWKRLQFWWRPGVMALLSVRLLAADCGVWRFLATVSAAWDDIGGWRWQE
jgi:hypothetical protein